MKKLLLISLITFVVIFMANGQARIISGSKERVNPLNQYTKVDYQAYYEFIIKNNGVWVKWSNPRLTTSADALYAGGSNGKRYNKTQLGVSSWLSNETLDNVTYYLNLRYPGGTNPSCGGSFETNGSSQLSWVCYLEELKGNPTSSIEVLGVNVEVHNGDEIVAFENKIKELEKSSEGKSANVNAGSTGTAQANAPEPSYTPSPTYSPNNTNLQNIAVIASGVSVLWDALNEGREKRVEERTAARDARLKRERELVAAEEERKRYTLEEANKGNVDGMRVLAFQAFIDKDQKKAFYWYDQASKMGNLEAKNTIVAGILNQKVLSFGYKILDRPSDEVSFVQLVSYISNINRFPKGKLPKSEYRYTTGDESKQFFNYTAYKELSEMFSKGIGCTKNLTMAKKMGDLYVEWKKNDK